MATDTTPEEAALVQSGSAADFTQAEADALNKAIATGGSAGALAFNQALGQNRQAATKAGADIGRSAAAIQAASPEVLAELSDIVSPVFSAAGGELGARQDSKGQAFGDLQALSTNFSQAAQSALPIVQQQADAARALAEGQQLAAATRGEFDLRQTVERARVERMRNQLALRELEEQADPNNLAAQIKSLGGMGVVQAIGESIRLSNPGASPDELTALAVAQGVPSRIARSLFGAATTGSVLDQFQDVATAERGATGLQTTLEALISRGEEGFAERLGGTVQSLRALARGREKPEKEKDPLFKQVFGDISQSQANKLLSEGLTPDDEVGLVDEIFEDVQAAVRILQEAGEPVIPARVVELVVTTNAGALPEGVPTSVLEFLASNIAAQFA